MTGRNLVEWVTDQLLLLYTLKLASEIKPLLKTRIQKILFFAQFESWEEKVGGLDYVFIRFNHGPFSKELKGDINRLRKAELIRITGSQAHHLNPEGENLLKEFKPILDRNKKILRIIQKHAKIIMDSEFEKMLNNVYSSPNPIYHDMTIGDTPMKKYLLSREIRPRDIKIFQITEAEAESLEILLDPQIYKKYLVAEKSVREKPLTPWRESSIFSK